MSAPSHLDCAKNMLVEVIKKTNAVQFGNFTLSSGASSSFYFDGRKVTLYAEGLYALGRVFYSVYESTVFNTVGGPATGAIPIISAVLSDAQWFYHYAPHGLNKPSPPYYGFFLRKEKKEHGLQQQMEGHCPEGAKVIVVDDTATSGNSLLNVVDFVQNVKKASVISCFVLVDRQEGAKELLEKRSVQLKSVFTQEELRAMI